VIDRTHSRQATLSFFPCSHSRFGSHPSLIPEKITPLLSRTYVQPILQPVCFQIHACNGDMPPFPPCLFTLLHRSIESQVTKSPVVHPLYAQQLTKCSSRNSFILKTIHFDGGYGVSSDLRTFRTLQRFLNLSPLFSHSCALFCTPQKLNSFIFKRFRTLRQKTQPPGVGKGVRQRSTSSCGVLAFSAAKVGNSISAPRHASHESLPLGALPFARGYRSARIRMEPHDT